MRTVPNKEDLFNEFKSDMKEKNGLPDSELIETVIGMANAEGGTIYVGVEDDGEITGLTKQHKDSIGVMAFIANKTVPSISTRAEVIIEDGIDVLKIEVPKSRSIAACANGKVLRRRLKFDGSPEVVPLFPYEISSRLSDLSLLDFSSRVLEDATIGDFDRSEYEHIRQIIQNNPGGDKNLLELQEEDFYKALHFVIEKEGIFRPTVTGILFAGKKESIKRLIPTYKASFQVLVGTSVKLNETLYDPLIRVIEKFTTYFTAWNPEKEIGYGIFRIPVPEFSFYAFREGLLNGFCHRDYTQLGDVRVLIDDEGMTISSQGGFIEGVNSENLISVEPHGRNPCLSEVFKRLGLVEKTGRGIDRIYEGSILFGRPWPDYSDSTSTIVKLFIPRAEPDMEFAKMIMDEQKKRGVLFSINALMILSFLKNKHKASLEQISKGIHASTLRTTQALDTLVATGLVSAVEAGSYILGSKKKNNLGDMRYGSIDKESIIKFAHDHDGLVSKEDLVSAFNVNQSQAYKLIRELVDDEKLVVNQRGKYANYKLADGV